VFVNLDREDLKSLVYNYKPFSMQQCVVLEDCGVLRQDRNNSDRDNPSWVWDYEWINQQTDEILLDMFQTLKNMRGIK
jgi:hypothetical protein